jgi:nanoRNase/pAp phosphatase (c-di-AMP/oligoRNAs hydrolase)
MVPRIMFVRFAHDNSKKEFFPMLWNLMCQGHNNRQVQTQERRHFQLPTMI